MDKTKLMGRIEKVEGREHTMYMLDGIPHIGVGHNIISRSLAEKTLEVLGIEDESDLMTVTLNDEQVDYLFERDLDIAIEDARQVVGEDVFDGLSSERQDVLVDMSYNLGRPRFKLFKKMLDAVQAGDFDEASAQILDSNAARDPLTKDRYEGLASEMRDGVSTAPASEEYEVDWNRVSTERLLDQLGTRLGIQILGMNSYMSDEEVDS